MEFSTYLRLWVTLLAWVGMASVTSTEAFGQEWLIASTLVALLGYFLDVKGYRLPFLKAFLRLSCILYLFFFFYDAYSISGVLLAAVKLTLFLQFYFLLSPKGEAEYKWLFLLSFIQLISTTGLTTQFSFSFFFLLYLISATFAYSALHLKREVETYGPYGKKGQEEIEAFMASRDVVSFPHVITTLLIAVLVMLSTITIFYFTPRPSARYLYRTDNETVDRSLLEKLVGFSKRVDLGIFGHIQEDDTIAMKIEVSEPEEALRRDLRWRGSAFDHYDGRSWSDSFTEEEDRKIEKKGEEDFFVLDRESSGWSKEPFRHTIYWEGHSPSLIFIPSTMMDHPGGVATDILGVKGPFVNLTINRNDTITSTSPYNSNIRYDVFSGAKPTAPSSQSPSYEENPHLRPYLQLPENMDERVMELAREWTDPYSSHYEKALAVERQLEENYQYYLGLEMASLNPLEDFLFKQKMGHCEYFATAMAILLREVGIPTRLVSGFRKGEWSGFGKFFIVRHRDAHAWVEVFFDDHGWLGFDPSPREAADYYLSRKKSELEKLLTRLWLVAKLKWQKHIVGFDQEEQWEIIQTVHAFMISLKNHLLTGLKALSLPLLFIAILGFLTVILSSLFLLILLKRKRFFWHEEHEATKYYRKMLKLLRKIHLEKEPSITPAEFTLEVGSNNSAVAPLIGRFTSLYNQLRFGGDGGEPHELEELRGILKELKKSLVKRGANT